MKKYNINPNNIEIPTFMNPILNINNKKILNNYKNKLKKKIKSYTIFSSKESKKRRNRYKEYLKNANKVKTKSNLENLSFGVSKIISESNKKNNKLIKELLKLQSNVL